jgi:aspartokinase-like uncharacterized kinase
VKDFDLAPVVVKVGGSLFDMPDLGPRLRKWLSAHADARFLLVPGGGPAANVVRDLDLRHGLGEEAAHWLALRALSLNAAFLATLLKDVPAQVVERLDECPRLWSRSTVAVIDAHAFALSDEGQPGCLPHRWSVTSDAVAARLASVCRASQLILLKSVTIPEEMSWELAGAHGYVDELFPRLVAELPRVRAINFRAAGTSDE